MRLMMKKRTQKFNDNLCLCLSNFNHLIDKLAPEDFSRVDSIFIENWNNLGFDILLIKKNNKFNVEQVDQKILAQLHPEKIKSRIRAEQEAIAWLNKNQQFYC